MLEGMLAEKRRLVHARAIALDSMLHVALSQGSGEAPCNGFEDVTKTMPARLSATREAAEGDAVAAYFADPRGHTWSGP